MILILIKTFSFLFPFIKEMFLGKGKNLSEDNNEMAGRLAKYPGVKKFLIGLGCFSLVLNIFIIKQVFILGKENVNLHKQITETKEIKPESTVPKVKEVPVPAPVPLDIPVAHEHTPAVVPKPKKIKPKNVEVDKSTPAEESRKKHQELIQKLNDLENYK